MMGELSKRSLIKHTCSSRDKLGVLLEQGVKYVQS